MVTNSNLEDFIEKIYSSYNLKKLCKYKLTELADILEIDVVLDSPKNRIVQDLIFIQSGSKEKQLEAFAHELGHYYRHVGHQKNMPVPYREFTEWQANQFAYHFCIPTFMLLKEDLPFCEHKAILIVAGRYGVTYRMAKKRLRMFEQKMLVQQEGI